MIHQPHLVMFDADRIKEFVFATGRLKEIRGASQIVRDATDKENIQTRLALRDDQVIFAEGGSGLLKVDNAQEAEKVCRKLENSYRTATHGTTLTAVSEPLGGGFQMAVQHAAQHLQLAKEEDHRRFQDIQSPFSQPCTSCGTFPAATRYAPGDLLCPACNSKRKRADSLRRTLATEEKLYLKDPPWGQQFLESLPMADKWQDVQLPYTLNDLATLSRPNNYLGFIHADGNGMGDLVQQQQSEAEYRRFSSRVSYSMRAALWLTLQTHFPDPRPHQDVRYAPFELIALGGDDVILVTVADQAVPVVLTLGRWFQHISLRLADLPESEITLESALAKGREAKPSLAKRLTDEEKAKAFTLSAGVVIAHPGQPILNLEERARELLHRAKRSHAGQAAIDFHVISNPVLRSLEDIRREEYTRHKARLTGRPMTFDDLDKLLRHILAFKEGDEAGRLPHNKLNALYEALFTGQNAAEFEAFFLLSRLNPAQQAKLEAFFAEFGISTQRTPDLNTPVLPWGLDEEDNVFTVFADLIELYEFTQANIRPEPSLAPEPSTNLTTEEEGDGSIQD